MMKYLLSFLFILSSLLAHDEINYKFSYFSDTTEKLSIEEVQNKSFTQADTKMLNLGITNTPHWFKLEFSLREKALNKKWWLKIDYPPLDFIDIYLFDKNNKLLSLVNTGELRPFKNRHVSDPAFIEELSFAKAGDYAFYILVQTEGALQVPIEIIDSGLLIKNQYLPILLSGLYYGLFIIILLYNSILYFYTKDKNYLLYITFATVFVFWQLSLDGIGIAFIWGDYPWIVANASTFGASGFALFAIIFARSFLQTTKYPKLDRVLKALLYLTLAIFISVFFAPYHYVIKAIGSFAIIVPVALIVAGFTALKDGYRPARFYVLGWVMFLVGCILFSLNKFALIGGFEVMSRAMQIGSAIEMILLSWALGDKIKSIRDEFLKKSNDLNKTLQQQVQIGLLKERQKDKMIIQQSRLAALGEMIEQIAHQWRQPLNTLALVNQNLYFKYKLNSFNEEDFDKAHAQIDENLQYMSQTIDDFRDFYKKNPQSETYNVEDVIRSCISISESMITFAKIQIIINTKENCVVSNIKSELMQVIMNIIKNAHDALEEHRQSNREIDFNLFTKDNQVHLSVEDNAGGIPEDIIDKIFNPYFTTKNEENGTGLGLYMSKSIIQDHMDGNIEVTNTKEGARFTIILPQAVK